MNEEPGTHEHDQQESQPVNDGPLPFLVAYGEGYVTRKDGTVVPFTFSSEAK
jgi:hypothetical protein